MKYGYYPIQETLPFLDLPPMEETVQGCNVDQISQTSVDKKSVEFILEHKDATLLFMTLTVSMTAKNEMPIVRPYTGKIPTDIRGIHRIAGKQLYHVAPHFYFSDEQILKYWNNPFKTEKILAHFAVSIGIDFSMTALFVVIFIDLIRNQKGRAGLIGALGLCTGILCLLIFGADKFLLPSLVLTVAVLSAGRPFFDPERRAAK